MERKNWKNKYAAENPEAYRKYQREYRHRRRQEDAEFRTRTTLHSLMSANKENPNAVRLNITPESLQMFNDQGACQICNLAFGEGVVKCLDHDHATGVVRGALCNKCNLGLGCFRDNPHFIGEAISYLQRHLSSV